jgi:two-component system, NarL family, sensor histidine kinase UhpB
MRITVPVWVIKLLTSRWMVIVVVFLFLPEICPGQTERDSLLSIIHLHQKDTSQVRALLELGGLTDDYLEGRSFYQQALVLSVVLKNKKLELATYQGITKLSRIFSHPDSAFYYGAKATQLAKALGDDNAVASVHIDIGNVYLNSHNYFKALSEFIAAAQILDSLKSNPKDQMTAYANIGNVQFLLENYDKSIDYMNQALLISKEIKYDLGTAYCYKVLGRVYRKQKKFELAKEAYQQSLSIYTRLDDRFQIAEVRQSLGNLYLDTNLFNEALEEYGKSLRISKSIQNVNQNAYAYAALGFTWNELKNYPKAFAYFDSTLAAAKGINPYLEMDSYYNLAEMSEKLGDKQRALTHFKRYSLLRDSLNKVENRAAAEEMEAKYQNTAQQNEIVLLKKDQELQTLALHKQRANTTLIIIVLFSVLVIGSLLLNRYRVMNRIKRQLALEQMRQTISRDLHDDIGSALSSINILSKVAQEEKDNTQNYLQRISDQSAKMMETMGDMVWSINPKNDSLEQVIVRMREFATEILDTQNIALEFVDNIPINLVLDAEKRRNLFLIFKEVINNAAKYSQATQVKVRLSQINNDIHLHISDNGKGFDESTVKAGNGLRNVRERAAEIGGSLMIKSESGKGTAVELQLHLG